MQTTPIQIKRRFEGAGGPPQEGGMREGELAVNVALTVPELWFFAGSRSEGVAPANKGWLRLNPTTSVEVSRWKIGGTARVDQDANDRTQSPMPFIVEPGELPIVVHNGQAYVFTGGTGAWGDPMIGHTPPVTPVTAAMFTPLGNTFTLGFKDFDLDPRVTAAAPADVGAAYVAAAGGGFAYTHTFEVVQFGGEQFFVVDQTTPDNMNSYLRVRARVRPPSVLDLTHVALAGGALPADIGAAYARWSAPGQAGAGHILAPVTLATFGSPPKAYILTDPTQPALAAGWTVLPQASVDAVGFRATLDISHPYPDAPAGGLDNRPNAWGKGEFALVAATGLVDGTPSADGRSWADFGLNAGLHLKQGDMLIWDGTNLVPIASESDMSAYLPTAGGVMMDGAKIEFDTTTAELPVAGGGLGGAENLVVIDAKGGRIDRAVLDLGTF